MAAGNSHQIEDWNGPLGQRWAEEQAYLDRLTGPFGEAALKAAAPRPGERIIDIGCGCGDTTLELARTVGAAGSVLGVDVSLPMLAVARRRLGETGLSNVDFRDADASSAALPRDQDLLFSRFGVMFFDAPVPAFAHMRRSLKDSGRLAFVCWRAPRENPWAMVPLGAGRNVVSAPPDAPTTDPTAPGPFAFADENRVRAILLEANFRDVVAAPVEAPVYLGSSPANAARGASRMGPLSRHIRDYGAGREDEIVAAVTTALEAHAAPDGSVSLPGACWVITANAG